MPTTDFRIERHEPSHIAVVERTAPRAELSAAFGECFGTVFSTLAGRGVAPMSMPMVRYLDMNPDGTRFEAGALVGEPIAPGDGISAATLPGGEIATATFHGPYDELPTAHEALVAWIAAQGRTAVGAPWEEYVTDPGEEPDPAKWQTRVSYPLA